MIEWTAPSVSRKIACPEGSLYVTIANDGDRVWVNATVGKGGTQALACSHSLSALAGTAIRAGEDPAKVALCLLGVTHEYSTRPDTDARSIPEGIGQAIWELL